MPLRKMVAVLEVLAPFCISSPQSRGKGIRSPPVGRKRRGLSFPQTSHSCCLRPTARSDPALGTSGERGGQGWREAHAPHGLEPGAVGCGGEEAEKPVRRDPSWEQDLLWDRERQVRARGEPEVAYKSALGASGAGTWVCPPGVLKLSR